MKPSEHLSPLRVLQCDLLIKKTGKPSAEVSEAMRLRNHLPAMAEEYLNNKDKDLPDSEKYPLWLEYLMLTSDDVSEF